jgi:hypothetical protein
MPALGWPERIFSWALLRAIGKLPIFVPAYFTLGLIISYAYALDAINAAVGSVRGRCKELAAQAADIARSTHGGNLLPGDTHCKYFEGISALTVSPKMQLLFLSAATLLLGTLLYSLASPQTTQSYDVTAWTAHLNKPPTYYYADAWSRRWALVPSGLLFCIGGTIALYLFLVTLYRALGAII